MKNIFLSISTVLLCLLGMADKLQAAPTVMEILTNMDEIENLRSDITVKAILTQNKVTQGVKLMEGVYYRRDRDDAYLIVITAPETDKGNGYLRVGENMWMYRRNTRTFQMMLRGQSIEGSDVDAGDLEPRKYADLYAPFLNAQGQEIVTAETLGKAQIPVYRFEVRARSTNVDYPKKVYWVRQDNFLKMKEESYALSGALMETIYYPKYTSIEGRYIPINQLVIDEFEQGNKTVLELSGISLEPIADTVFTKAYLENLSK